MKKLNIILIALATCMCANAKDMKDLKIYVNPGHGGYDADDRNVAVPMHALHDTTGFYESKSNLVKGFALRDMLQGFGADVMMSRTQNRTEDDRCLDESGREGSNYGADFFFSIHSNATGTSSRYNQPLMLYRGYNNDPVFPEAKEMSLILNLQLLENQVASWSSTNTWLAGDWNFYDWGTSGLGVLRVNTVPSMLSEGSHHDYIPETCRLMNKEYCWLEAYHFVKSIMEYFGTSESFTTGVVAGTAYDSWMVREDEIYGNVFYGHDKAKPLCGATVKLINAKNEVVDTYITDNEVNGVYLFKDVQPGTYTLQVEHPDYHTYSTTVAVEANKVTYHNPQVMRHRDTAPEVVEYSPVYADGDEAVICNTPIRIKFNWDMNPEVTAKAFSITPAVAGTITWEESHSVLVFTPKKVYDTNTVYTVKIDKSAKHPENLSMADDFTFSFKTGDYNEYVILSKNPNLDAKVHYVKPTIEFRFAGQPNSSFIKNEITVEDEAGNTLAYNGRSYRTSSSDSDYGFFQIQLSKNLEIGKTYYVRVADNVRDSNNIPVATGGRYPFVAVDAATEGSTLTLVQSFDDASLLVANEDASAGFATNTIARYTAVKLEGTSSYKWTYSFNEFEGGKVAIDFATAPETTFSSANCMDLKVYGDLSLNTLNAVFTNGTEVKKAKLCEFNFLGWEDLNISLADYLTDAAYTLTGFEIEQAGGQTSRSGAVYLDKLGIGAAAQAGIDNIEVANVRVYPNPASELLIANGDKTILGIELVSLDGKSVAKAGGNVMNVSEVPNGVYVAKIYTQNGYGAKQVVVKH